MKPIGIVTDSHSGIAPENAQKMGIFEKGRIFRGWMFCAMIYPWEFVVIRERAR